MFCASAAHGEERVLEFHSDIRIAADGQLTVTERILLVAEGNAIQRGILRDFPTVYRDEGRKITVPFAVRRVLRNGLPEPYAVERTANGVRIRIGRADVLLERGRHVYEISYRTARQVGFFEKHDELYWNVNGNGWTLGFDRISAEVQLPARVPARELKLEAWTGLQGARGRNYVTFARDGAAAFRSTRAFWPREGMTIVVAFPKGIVAPPSAGQRARWFVADHAGVLAGLGGLALLLAFLAWRWGLVGRDPKSGPKFPRYQAPPQIGPAGVRFVDRMGYDERCFAAALLGLGSRGYLKIRQAKEQGYEIERTGKSVDWLLGEQVIPDMLLGPGKPVTIGSGHSPGVQLTRDRFRAELERYFGGKLFSKNHGSLFAGIGIALATFAAMLWLEAPELFIGAMALVMLLLLLAFSRWLPAYSVAGRRLQDEIEGLRQYLSVAEMPGLARMKAPPRTKEEFAKFLPYAVALGVEKTWAERFAAILGAAAVSAAVADFYTSESDFASSFSGLDSSISSSATAPGSDSGSDGGGSSGGGGGGGGGSGW